MKVCVFSWRGAHAPCLTMPLLCRWLRICPVQLFLIRSLCVIIELCRQDQRKPIEMHIKGAFCIYAWSVEGVSARCTTLWLKKFRTPVIFSNNSNRSGPILTTFGRENRQWMVSPQVHSWFLRFDKTGYQLRCKEGTVFKVLSYSSVV